MFRSMVRVGQGQNEVIVLIQEDSRLEQMALSPVRRGSSSSRAFKERKEDSVVFRTC